MNIPGRKYFRSETVLSDWFPRGGDDAFFRAERIFKSSSSVQLKIEFLTKNSEDVGDGLEIVNSGGTALSLDLLSGGSDPSIEQELIRSVDGTAGTPPKPRGFKELVRLKITVPAGGTSDWMLARIFPPIFFDRADS